MHVLHFVVVIIPNVLVKVGFCINSVSLNDEKRSLFSLSMMERLFDDGNVLDDSFGFDSTRACHY